MVPSSGSQYSQETMRKYLYGGGTVLVILILAAIIVVLILRTVYHKRKVNDSNTYRHLAFSGKEETLEVSKNKQSFLHVRWETLPLHDAIKKNDWKRFKKSVDEGANVNAYCADFVWRGTPLLLSIRAKLPIKFAQYLIKNGADLTLMDHQYKTPLMMAEEMGNREMVQMLKKCENKKYDRRLPPKFSHEEYRVHLFGSSDEAVTKNKLHSYTGEEEFREKFIGNETNKIEEATHIVVPTLEDGSVELDLSNISVQKLLPYFFGPKMIMKPIWLKASVENWKNFKNDFKFRVESVTINGNKYDTVVKIHGSIQERRLPFLLKIRAYFIGGTQEMWYPLAKSINALGGISHKHGCIPKQNDEQFFDIEGVSETPYFYHRDDLGPVFIFTDNREHLRRNRPFMFKYNMYHHIEPISFLELVFGFNTRHYKLYGGKEDKDTLVLDRFSQFNGIAKVRDEDPIDVEWPDLN